MTALLDDDMDALVVNKSVILTLNVTVSLTCSGWGNKEWFLLRFLLSDMENILHSIEQKLMWFFLTCSEFKHQKRPFNPPFRLISSKGTI